VLAEPVTTEIERHDAQAREVGNNAKPVAEMAAQPVQEDDGRALSRLGMSQPVHRPDSRPRVRGRGHAEAGELSEALRAAADRADRLDAAMIPHLEAALEAGKLVMS
jgi:hypothetical protein